ncbi:hypothetical protein BRADI_3g51362v3 [Brachypodium distachyon]|uniref:Secreted protein n=1 Tax=Brachypodium distachyon TaxID=15368 RepID=A0A0Q3JQ70_BRADI|nr:hypothetical protein BRADI_3g51362v3 [Brachypodium distachyon]
MTLAVRLLCDPCFWSSLFFSFFLSQAPTCCPVPRGRKGGGGGWRRFRLPRRRLMVRSRRCRRGEERNRSVHPCPWIWFCSLVDVSFSVLFLPDLAGGARHACCSDFWLI